MGVESYLLLEAVTRPLGGPPEVGGVIFRNGKDAGRTIVGAWKQLNSRIE